MDGFQSATFAIDRVLRRRYGVHEFSDAPGCVLRASIRPARHLSPPARLALAAGDQVAELHFWNERMLLARGDGPDLAWGIRFRAALICSLALLARAFASEPMLWDVQALCADVPFQTPGRLPHLVATVGRFGFIVSGDEAVGTPLTPDRLADFWAAVLCRACGAGFRRRRFLRDHHYRLWMTREMLLTRYGPGEVPRTDGAPARLRLRKATDAYAPAAPRVLTRPGAAQTASSVPTARTSISKSRSVTGG